MEIRKLQESDLPTRVEWMNNPSIYRGMHFELPITLEKTIQWFHNNICNTNRVDLVVHDVGSIVAFCGITHIDPILHKGESYTFVHPEKHGKGLGKMSRIMLLDYAFKELKLNKVYCFTNEDNVPSWKLSESLGFKLEGRMRMEYMTPEGVLKDCFYHGLLRDEWMDGTVNGQ